MAERPKAALQKVTGAGNFLDRRPIRLDGFQPKAKRPKALVRVPGTGNFLVRPLLEWARGSFYRPGTAQGEGD